MPNSLLPSPASAPQPMRYWIPSRGALLDACEPAPFDAPAGFSGCLFFTAEVHHEGRTMYAAFDAESGLSLSAPKASRESAANEAKAALRAAGRTLYRERVAEELAARGGAR